VCIGLFFHSGSKFIIQACYIWQADAANWFISETGSLKMCDNPTNVIIHEVVHTGLDEPTTGLHLADIQRLLDCLNRLVNAGHTVIVIEHNLDVVKTAKWIIDLGPEGCEDGGFITADGTPEEVATVEASYTGQLL
jgi:ABC-type hemin transport system ATPase subunit